MPVTVLETYESQGFVLSRTGSADGYTLKYTLYGSEDVDAIKTALLATAPTVYKGRVRDRVSADPVGNGVWTGSADYITIDNDEYTFDTGGGVIHRTEALSTINTYAASGFTAPDFAGAINVNGDRIDGIDVPSPNYQFSETHTFDNTAITNAYKLVLFNLTGRFNNATFKGFASGEVMFLGAAGSQRGNEEWSITYRFACSPNVTGLTVGTITGIDKLGWDYLWVHYRYFVDGAAYMLVPRPVAAYVVRVSQPGDFSTLNIGT